MSVDTVPAARRDEPRRVSPEPLNVAPALIGAPLAPPMRRALAMGVDLLVVALLSGVSGLWLAGGLVLVALQLRHEQTGAASPLRRWAGWALVALFVGLAAREAWQGWHEKPTRGEGREAAGAMVDDALREAGVASAPARGRRHARRGDAADAAAVARAASEAASVVAGLERAGLPPTVASSVQGAVTSAMQEAVTRMDKASAQGASAAASSTSDAASGPAVAIDPRIAELEAELAEARREAKRNKPLTLREEFERLLDAVGASFGWGVVYFSLLPAFWNGQTLGKRLFKLKVVELTGRPMTVMRCLRRYGGYAAGMATGGLGFAQVMWDVNRQGIQDRCAHTVVIDARAAGAGGSITADQPPTPVA